MGTNGYIQESNPNDWALFEDAMATLQAELANAGVHGAVDGSVRAAYDRQVRALSAELRRKALAGHVTWKEAAAEANAVRNTVMENMRWRWTPVGRAYAQSLKSAGRTLNEMIAKKTVELFGKAADFNQLSSVQKSQVYAAVVDSAGQSRPRVTARMRNVSRAGRGLIACRLPSPCTPLRRPRIRWPLPRKRRRSPARASVAASRQVRLQVWRVVPAHLCASGLVPS